MPHDNPTPPDTDQPTTDAHLHTLQSIERRLDEIRILLDQQQRTERYREFSPARLMGAIAQALVIGLLAWALVDWVFQDATRAFVKLGFATVLQLAALTAFTLVPRDK